jgi:hypothetical protein
MGYVVGPVLDVERARRKEGALRATLFRSVFSVLVTWAVGYGVNFFGQILCTRDGERRAARPRRGRNVCRCKGRMLCLCEEARRPATGVITTGMSCAVREGNEAGQRRILAFK